MALALRSDYRESLALTQREIGFRHIRGHGLFSKAMGILREDLGVRRYGFTYLDQVVDMYLELGIRPFLELGFMPKPLATGEESVFWWEGNITPPADHEEWAELVKQTLRHLIERYGISEVKRWPIEVWNEPNLVQFWKDADQPAYFKLYEASALAVKEVDAELQVGGPAVAPRAGTWYEDFTEFVTANNLPCDFFSAHAYSSGPAQHIPFGVYQTLYPPSDLLEQFARPAQALRGTALESIPVHITEFNTSYHPLNPIHDTAYNSAYLAPVLAGGGELVDSFSYWTFSDVFEEQGIPTSFFHGGFGLLGYRQVRKPTYHLYAFMARLGEDVLAQGEDFLATRTADGRVMILAWQPLTGSEEFEDAGAHRLNLTVVIDAEECAVIRRRVDEECGNAWAAWRDLGRPMSPTAHELELLHEASTPALSREAKAVVDGKLELAVELGNHALELIEIIPVTTAYHEGLDDRRLLGG
jgi:xylan 1,4-beta-xylosidase